MASRRALKSVRRDKGLDGLASRATRRPYLAVEHRARRALTCRRPSSARTGDRETGGARRPRGLAEAYRRGGNARELISAAASAADGLFARARSATRRLSGSGRIEGDVVLWRLAMQCWGYLPAARWCSRGRTSVLEQRHQGMAEAFALVVRGRYRGLQGDLAAGRDGHRSRTRSIREFGAVLYVAGSGAGARAVRARGGRLRRCGDARFRARRTRCSSDGRVAAGRRLMSRGPRSSRGGVDEAEAPRARSRGDSRPRTTSRADGLALHAREDRSRGEASRGGRALAREAVALAEQTDFLDPRARVSRARGRARRRAAAMTRRGGGWSRRSAIRAQGKRRSASTRARARLRELDARAARRTRLGPRAHATDRRRNRRAPRTARSARPPRGSGARPRPAPCLPTSSRRRRPRP